MRVLLDGEYFATGDNLDVIAEIADMDVSRLSFHPEDLAELEERAAERKFERQMLEGYSSVAEFVAAIASDDSPGRSGGPRQRAQEKLEELRRKRDS